MPAKIGLSTSFACKESCFAVAASYGVPMMLDGPLGVETITKVVMT